MWVHWNWSEKGWWDGKSDSSRCPVFLNDNLWAGGHSGGGVEPFVWVSAWPCWGCEQVPAKCQSVKIPNYLLDHADIVSRYQQEGRCPEVQDEVRILNYFYQLSPQYFPLPDSPNARFTQVRPIFPLCRIPQYCPSPDSPEYFPPRQVRILRYFVQMGPDERQERNVGALVSPGHVVEHKYSWSDESWMPRRQRIKWALRMRMISSCAGLL